MIGIKLRGGFLDIDPGVVVSIIIQPAMYLGGDVKTVPGSYTLPLTLSLTSKNKRLTGYADRIDTSGPLLQDEPVEFHLNGTPFLFGSATVKQGGSKIKLYAIFNEAADLKGVDLTDLDLGGQRSFNGIIEAEDSMNNPSNYDFIFFPVYNPSFFEDDNRPSHAFANVQNMWVDDGNAPPYFENSSDNLSAMPFVKLNYLLQRIYNHIGLQVDNLWQIDTELQGLVLYNNYSIYNLSGQWDDEINLKNHVPKIRATKLLKEVVSTYNLGIFPDIFRNKSSLVPMRDIIKAPPKHDWTNKRASKLEFSSEINYPTTFRYKNSGSDDLFGEYVDPPTEYEIDEFNNDRDPISYFPVNVYAHSTNSFYRYASVLAEGGQGFYSHITKAFLPHIISAKGSTLESELTPLFMTPEPITDLGYIPHIKVKGTIPPLNQYSTIPLRIIQHKASYRAKNNAYRYAENYVPGEPSYDYSQLWSGTKSVFDTWWKSTIDFLSNRKDGTVQLNLKLKDILAYSTQDKIRIDNMNYLVKKLKLNFTTSGILPSQATVVSVD